MARKYTILVVDDEPDVVKSVQDLLRLDYRVMGATQAVEGLRIMENEEVHVVMSDQRMPGMSGVEFLGKIRGAHPEAIRLLFTGYADIRAVIDAINEGNVYRYVTKPWDPEELQAIIRQAVERYQLIVDRKTLTEQLKDKNKELEQANEALQEADKLKTAFIRVASHELRTPLTILLGLSRLAVRMQNVPPPLPEWLVRIKSAGERLQRLVDQIVAMLSAGQYVVPLNRQMVGIERLLDEVADDVRPFIEMRHQVLAVDKDGNLGTMSLDASKMRESLNHLLLNAIKFTADGGRIALAARRTADGGVEFRVSDSGVGIEPESMQRLFQPFFTGFDVRHHSSGHFEYNRKGIGLGLSVVKSLVEMQQGKIEAQSKPGSGATFIITLPAPQ